MKHLIVSLRALLLFAFVLSFLYPVAVTVVGARLFPAEAEGSLIRRADGSVVGSALLAQEFKGEGYFHARPSAVGYNPLPSGGSNLGPTSKALREKWNEARAAGASGDLLAASASGLDPHVSPASARAQVARVAQARRLPEAQVTALLDAHTEGRELRFLGERRVNVLLLNLALDQLSGN